MLKTYMLRVYIYIGSYHHKTSTVYSKDEVKIWILFNRILIVVLGNSIGNPVQIIIEVNLISCQRVIGLYIYLNDNYDSSYLFFLFVFEYTIKGGSLKKYQTSQTLQFQILKWLLEIKKNTQLLHTKLSNNKLVFNINISQY